MLVLTVSNKGFRWAYRLLCFRVALRRFLANKVFGMFDGIGGGRESLFVGLADSADPTIDDGDLGSLNGDLPELPAGTEDRAQYRLRLLTSARGRNRSNCLIISRLRAFFGEIAPRSTEPKAPRDDKLDHARGSSAPADRCAGFRRLGNSVEVDRLRVWPFGSRDTTASS